MTGGPEWESRPPAEPPPSGRVPMRVGTILEVGVRILRRHWALLLGLSLLFAGPGALLTAATGIRVNEVALDIFPGISEGIIEEGMVITDDQLARITGALVGYVIAALVAGVLASIGALGFSAVVAADYHGRRIQMGEVLRICLSRAPAALAFMLATSLVVIGLVLGGVVVILLVLSLLPGASGGAGGPGAFAALVVVVIMVIGVTYLTMRWAPAFPAMVNEGLGAREALARSWHLSGDNVWRIFFIVAFGAVAAALMATVLSQILGVLILGLLAPALGLDDLIAQSIALAAGTVLLAALVPVLTAVLYFDLRTRRDFPAASPPSPSR
ncbi:MAG: glycerophosphoryl diester phosphodiesterase membrane domain-containing protein [Candidatus Limnocylindrales bacterium]